MDIPKVQIEQAAKILPKNNDFFSKVEIVSYSTCRAAYPWLNHHSSMCAIGSNQSGFDACMGDSGGPLTWTDEVDFTHKKPLNI